ncbi:MAG: hypothetical protein P8M34_10640 [Saprospiraceae bacterium]|nr:hypothetical protein [Saprospiraceae bacterium]
MKSNLLLVVGSLVGMILFGELVVFRFLLLPSDIPRIEQKGSPGVLSYKPKQEGIWRIRNHTQAPYRINSAGWNSAFDYDLPRTPNRRIAIIGDSYIEALQVPFSESVAELLAEETRFEVYRFGISGAPLSQYLYMLEHEVLPYSPDVVVFNIVYNDFLESFEGSQRGTYTKSFAKWRLDSDGVVTEVTPIDYDETLRSLIKRTATFRYLVARMHVRPSTLWRRVSQMFETEKGRETLTKRYVGNVSVAEIDQQKIKWAITFFIKRLRQLLHQETKTLILVDGKRDLSEEDCRDGQVAGAMDFAVKHFEQETLTTNFAFVSLAEIFRTAWCSDKLELSIPNDGHWTKYTHALIADQIKNYLNSVGFGR